MNSDDAPTRRSGDFALVADARDLDRLGRRAAANGQPVCHEVADVRAGGLYVAAVADLEAAQRAVLAALAGADLAVHCLAPDDVVDALVGDLTRLGTVRRVPPFPDVDEEDVALLALLREGRSLGEAATRLHLSRRTADRRLARARRTLGVRTTPEAMVAAERLGLLPVDPGTEQRPGTDR